jgi:hypothetical protein
MNEDHEDTHAPLLNFFLERSDVRSAVMTGVDRLGCDFDAITDGAVPASPSLCRTCFIA